MRNSKTFNVIILILAVVLLLSYVILFFTSERESVKWYSVVSPLMLALLAIYNLKNLGR